MNRKITLLFFALILSIGAFAQITITGKITDKQGALLAGVSVREKGTQNGTQSDNTGKYQLKVSSKEAVLLFSFLGYTEKQVASNGSSTIDVSLEESANMLGEVVVSVGSRSNQRTIIDSPIPVDIIGASDLKSTGQASFDKALQYKVPSFNTVNTPVNDATSLLDPYEIRNMGPSRTLVLINGKRKNSSALTYIQTSPGRGESGADISSIPSDAIKRVEILRDGASAQYGSDAIAGVMNIILKDRQDEGSVSLNTGITHKGDGQMIGLSLNNGASFGSKGFINYTADFQRTTLANRPGTVDAEGDAADFGANINDVKAFLALKPDAGNINGAPETSSAKFLVNSGIPVGENSELYFNAAYVYKQVNSFANYRTPYWRTVEPGTELLTPAGGTYLGYVPTFEGDLNDYNGTLGFRTEKNGWKTDVSFTTGSNKILFTVNNSRNRGLGSSSPISFKPGGYTFSHNVGNIDITKPLSEKLTMGMGSEFRAEKFQIIAGDTASYVSGGADSFPGIGASNAITATRFNFGGYFDLGYDVTDNFLINGTARVEQYSDFGSAFVWKLSSRLKASDKLVFRSSLSTGFRAPSLQQINLQLAQASFVPGSGIQSKGIFNNNSAEARLMGISKLKSEKSLNFTAGIGLNPSNNFSITLDYYNIKMKDRIILGPETPTTIIPGVVAASFFLNGLDTRTEGLDFVANYRNIELGTGKIGVSLAGNYTFKNTAVGDHPLVDDTQEALLLSSRPKYKAVIGSDYKKGKVSINLNNTVFGPTTFHQNGIHAGLNTEFATKMVTDLGGSIQLTKNVNLSANIQNLFNVMPKWKLVTRTDVNSETLTGANDILNDPGKLKTQINLLTFNGRYSNVTYDGSHFSQMGTTFVASLNVKF